jgi:hypothetical protein
MRQARCHEGAELRNILATAQEVRAHEARSVWVDDSNLQQ